MMFCVRLAIATVLALINATALSQDKIDQAILESDELPRTQVVQQQVSEGLSLSAGMRHAVIEFYQAHGRFPDGNAEAGIDNPIRILGKYVISITIGPSDGSIAIEYGNYADPIISGATLTLCAEVKEPQPVWHCRSEHIDRKYFPAACAT